MVNGFNIVINNVQNNLLLYLIIHNFEIKCNSFTKKISEFQKIFVGSRKKAFKNGIFTLFADKTYNYPMIFIYDSTSKLL